MNRCSPRWTYGEVNASRWRPLFGELTATEKPLKIPLVETRKRTTAYAFAWAMA